MAREQGEVEEGHCSWGAERKGGKISMHQERGSGPDHIRPSMLGNFVLILQVSRKKPMEECKHEAREFPVRFVFSRRPLWL